MKNLFNSFYSLQIRVANCKRAFCFLISIFFLFQNSLLSSEQNLNPSNDLKKISPKTECLDKSGQPCYERWKIGIVPGLLFLNAQGKRNYVGNAYVDGNGIIQVENRYEHVGKALFALTGYLQLCKPFDSTIVSLGATVGYTEGTNSSNFGNGAFAFGASLLFTQSDENFFGLFFGNYYDPTVKKLAYPYMEGAPYPSKAIRTDGSVEATLANRQITVPTQSGAAVYQAFGIMFKKKISF